MVELRQLTREFRSESIRMQPVQEFMNFMQWLCLYLLPKEGEIVLRWTKIGKKKTLFYLFYNYKPFFPHNVYKYQSIL